jgi:hypothetical protein
MTVRVLFGSPNVTVCEPAGDGSSRRSISGSSMSQGAAQSAHPWPRREPATTLPRLAEQKLYRPRRPERSPFYAVLHQFFDRFTREYEHRFDRCSLVLQGKYPVVGRKRERASLTGSGFPTRRVPTKSAVSLKKTKAEGTPDGTPARKLRSSGAILRVQ